MIWLNIVLILVMLFCIREVIVAIRLRAALRDFISVMNNSTGVNGIPIFVDEKKDGIKFIKAATWDLIKAQGWLDNYLKLTRGEIDAI